jgi:NAD(P)H-dependent FMN reductase
MPDDRDDQLPNVKVLTVCGSLQHQSANRSLLDVATGAVTGRGAAVDVFDRLAAIPAFDADRQSEVGAVVTDWRCRVAAADVVLIAAPEYAGGLAGAVKNALDWLVGSGELYRKPVAIMSAGTTGGLHARRMLAQTLTWQGAYVVGELGVAAPRTKSGPDGRFTDEGTLAAVEAVCAGLLEAVALAPAAVVTAARRVVGALHVDVDHVAPPVDAAPFTAPR